MVLSSSNDNQEGTTGSINDTIDIDVITLHNATEWDNVILLSELLAKCEPECINSKDSLGQTLVYKAVLKDSVNCLKFLLDNRADPDMAARSKKTPLHCAIAEGKTHIAEMLLDHNASVDIVDGENETSLQLAEVLGNWVIVDRMKAHRERRRIMLKSYFEDLQVACVQGSVETTKRLLDQIGSDVTYIINDTLGNNYPPLCLACRYDNYSIAELLLQYGANCTGHPLTLESPLHLACEFASPKLVQLILEVLRNMQIAVVKEIEGNNSFIDEPILLIASFRINHLLHHALRKLVINKTT